MVKKIKCAQTASFSEQIIENVHQDKDERGGKMR